MTEVAYIETGIMSQKQRNKKPICAISGIRENNAKNNDWYCFQAINRGGPRSKRSSICATYGIWH